MFAPEILAPISELAEYYAKEIARLRMIARAVAGCAELWIRLKHGSWRFFLVTPDSLAGIDREGDADADLRKKYPVSPDPVCPPSNPC